jgi:excinuclease ABC subunit C
VINRHFQLRTCTDHVLNSRTRPCILYQIKRCPAPCVYPVPPEVYAEQVKDAAQFLGGKRAELLPRLHERMKEKAKTLEYERAAQIRDQIAAVTRTLESQSVVHADFVDQDVVGFYRKDDVVEAVVLFMRQGKLLGRRSFQLKDQEMPDPEVVRHFVRQYYDLEPFIPDEVLLPVEIEDAPAIADWLRELSGHRVEVFAPKRGAKVKLLELAEKNAEASFASRKSQAVDALASLGKLQQRLGLRRLPRRIECFDIAHIQGAATVASMVVFVDGEPQKSHYRKFRVKTVTNDDFAAMYEVLSRRFRRLKTAGAASERGPVDSAWQEPDLLIVDGGKGQLGTALAALRDAGWEITAEKGFDVIGLAKERDDADGTAQPDRVYLRNVKDPIKLKPSSTELFLLARIRDEAHRSANLYHRRTRGKKQLRSQLEDVPGVGSKRKRLLLRHFGSLKQIKAATVEELAAVPGMSKRAAEAVKRYLGG